VHICTGFGGLVELAKYALILSSPIGEGEMATFARADAAPSSVGLESFSATRTAMTPKSELALTSLVVIALLAGAAPRKSGALRDSCQRDVPKSRNFSGSPSASEHREVQPICVADVTCKVIRAGNIKPE